MYVRKREGGVWLCNRATSVVESLRAPQDVFVSRQATRMFVRCPTSMPMIVIFLILGHLLSLCWCKVINSPASIINQSFDYIVIGGGLCGTVVAARLSENSNVSVLMIEVGTLRQLGRTLTES